MTTDPRRTYKWQQLRRHLIATATHCAICQQPIPAESAPRSRWSPSLDHIQSLMHGGQPFDPANLRVVHYGCNASRGATHGNHGRQPRPQRPPPASRDW